MLSQQSISESSSETQTLSKLYFNSNIITLNIIKEAIENGEILKIGDEKVIGVELGGEGKCNLVVSGVCAACDVKSAVKEFALTLGKDGHENEFSTNFSENTSIIVEPGWEDAPDDQMHNIEVNMIAKNSEHCSYIVDSILALSGSENLNIQLPGILKFKPFPKDKWTLMTTAISNKYVLDFIKFGFDGNIYRSVYDYLKYKK